MFEHTRTYVCAQPYVHAHSRSMACSSWVFCRLDPHQCSLRLHYCYLNVEGRSGASINSILSTVGEAQDTQTSTHRHTLLRKSRRHTSRAIWITNSPAICRTTEYSQPFRHISQQSFDLGFPRTTWRISNALLSRAAQFKCAAWWEVCFWRWNFPLRPIWPCPLQSDAVGGTRRVRCGNVLFCQGQSEASRNTASDGIVLNWWRPPLPSWHCQTKWD